MTEAKVKRLLHRDILIKHVNINDLRDSQIRIIDNEHLSDLKYFEVLDRSDNVTEIEIGDIVALPFSKVMMPFEINNERVTITSEDEVWFVYER